MTTTVSSGPAAAPRTPRAALPRRRLTVSRRRQFGAAYALILPFLVLFVTMIVVPLFYAGWISLFKKRLIGGTSFAGAENYLRALTDPSFLERRGPDGPVPAGPGTDHAGLWPCSPPWPWTAA